MPAHQRQPAPALHRGPCDRRGRHGRARCRARHALARHGGLQRWSATPPRLLTDHTFSSGNVCIDGRPSLDRTQPRHHLRHGRCSAPLDGPFAAANAVRKLACMYTELGHSRPQQWRLRLNNMLPVPIPDTVQLSSRVRGMHTFSRPREPSKSAVSVLSKTKN